MLSVDFGQFRRRTCHARSRNLLTEQQFYGLSTRVVFFVRWHPESWRTVLDSRSVVRSRRYLLVLLLAIPRASALAQVWHDDPETLKRVIALHLPNAPGPVPVYYSPEFKARALRYQKALSACKQWYEQQVNTHADFSLAVLNKADWEKVDKSAYPMPHEFSTIVVLPGRMEDFPGALTDDLELLAENIAFHEAGHIYSNKFIAPADPFLAELYANVFMVAYLRAQRPDMVSAFLQGPPAKLGQQRYISLEDLQYLNPWGLMSSAGMTNVGWFQFQVYHLCDLLLRGKSLSQVLSELKIAFQDKVPRPFSVIAAKLEGIHPGLGAQMGRLWGPTTIAEAKGCGEGGGTTPKRSLLVVENLSAKPIVVTAGTQPPVTVQPNSWTTLDGNMGERVQTDRDSCFLIGAEPAITRISSPH
jgi:hypothetical protein